MNFQEIDKNIIKTGNHKNKRFNINYKKYGFPFIGNDWIPHVTIASIKKQSKKNILMNRFLKEKIKNKTLPVEFISIWKITGDNHKKIFQYSLK